MGQAYEFDGVVTEALKSLKPEVSMSEKCCQTNDS